MGTLIKAKYREYAERLVEIREQQERNQEIIDAHRANLMESSPIYVAMLEAETRRSKTALEEAEVKRQLGEELVDVFRVFGEKKFPGIGDIAIRRKVQYEDAPAIKWAISAGMHALLKVDRSAADKAFEGLADNLDFVEVVEEPFARIASKTLLVFEGEEHELK